MNRVFGLGSAILVPDGTIVYPFLNPFDSTSGLSSSLPNVVSMAGGLIAPRYQSKIQILPFVTQITFVSRGTLITRMKGSGDEDVYDVCLAPNQAALTEPGTFLQLHNPSDEPCDVFYIIAPGYVFLVDDPALPPIYDDSVVLDEDWDGLRTNDWQLSKRLPTLEDRNAAITRIQRGTEK